MLVVLPALDNDDAQMISRYTMFWIVLLISKLAFSYYAEVSHFGSCITATKILMIFILVHECKVLRLSIFDAD